MLKLKELPKLGAFANDINFHGAIPFIDIPDAYATQLLYVYFHLIWRTQGLVAPEAISVGKTVVLQIRSLNYETIVD